MVALTEMGAIIAPPMPGFYHHPATVMDIVDHSVDRVLDLLGRARRTREAVGRSRIDEAAARLRSRASAALSARRPCANCSAPRPSRCRVPRFEDMFRNLKQKKVDGAVVPIENTPGRLGARELRPPAALRTAHRGRDQRAHRAQPDRAAGRAVRQNPARLLAPGGAEPVPGLLRRQPADRKSAVLRHRRQREDGDGGGAARTPAAIASAVAAEIYGARILRRSIEDDRQNFTRFFLLRTPEYARRHPVEAAPPARRGRPRWCSAPATSPARCSAP